MSAKLVCFIASHLECDERVNNFIKLLDIIASQKKCSQKNIYISLSHDSHINIVKVLQHVKIYDFIVVYSQKKLSQFEHYNKLIKTIQIDDPENTWIIFSDDDDIWSENRLFTCESLINKKEMTDQIIYLKFSSYALIGGRLEPMGAGKNYVDYCIRYKYIKLFFDNVSAGAFKHKFCDIFFMNLMANYGAGELKHLEIGCEDKLYIWTNTNYGMNSSTSCVDLDSMDTIIMNNFDLFMAYYAGKNIKKFKDFMEFFIKPTICDYKKYYDQIRKIYNENRENHVFSIELTKIY